MTDTPTLHVSAARDDATPPPRNIVLLGPASLYQDAMKCLIENRVAQAIVTHADETAVLQSHADVVLFDVDLERVTDARLGEVSATMKSLAPRPVVLITSGVEASVLQRLLSEGVAGIVMKSSPSDTLVQAIESVSAGKVWLQRDLLAETFGDSSHVRRNTCSQAEKIAQLTQREREIIAVASCGLPNRQVAKKLNLSEATVRHHLSSVFAKLGVANRGELIIFAYRHGLADEEVRHRLC